jgi:hypothetical protein
MQCLKSYFRVMSSKLKVIKIYKRNLTDQIQLNNLAIFVTEHKKQSTWALKIPPVILQKQRHKRR